MPNKATAALKVQISEGTYDLVLGIFVVIAIIVSVSRIVTIVRNSQRVECVAEHPCSLKINATGSTDKIAIPDGWRLCFYSFSWDDVPGLGFMTSHRGGPERQYLCTQTEVAIGTCEHTLADSFRFIPKKGVQLPLYWFANKKNGKSGC